MYFLFASIQYADDYAMCRADEHVTHRADEYVVKARTNV